MLDEKKKGDDSDDEGNDLPDVGIQAPNVTQKSQQASACDHNGVTTRKCQNCPLRENPQGRITGIERKFAPLELLDDIAEGNLTVAPR